MSDDWVKERSGYISREFNLPAGTGDKFDRQKYSVCFGWKNRYSAEWNDEDIDKNEAKMRSRADTETYMYVDGERKRNAGC